MYYGIKNQRIEEDSITYRKLLPRLLDFLERKNIKATFFIIGSHIKNEYHLSVLRRIIDEGHELANHTFTHNLNFSGLSMKEKEEEISKCEEIIKRVSGRKPLGFRAPGWNINAETIKILANRGYLYDTSIFPSWWYLLSWTTLFIINRNVDRLKPLKNFMNIFAPIIPYHPDLDKIYCRGKIDIIEIPVSVSPFFRAPFYNSLFFSIKSRFLFDRSLKKIYQSHMPLNYVLHTTDFYDRDDDKINKLYYPAITYPLSDKIKIYNYIFDEFLAYYELVTIKDLVSTEKSEL